MVRKWRVGDLVWADTFKPVWPGQIMDPATALRKVQAAKKPGTVLVSLFGDNSWAWVAPDKVFALDADLASRSKAKCSPVYKV